MRQHGSFREVWKGWREIGVWRVAVGHGKGVEGVERLVGLLRGHTPRRKFGEGGRR